MCLARSGITSLYGKVYAIDVSAVQFRGKVLLAGLCFLGAGLFLAIKQRLLPAMLNRISDRGEQAQASHDSNINPAGMAR